MNKSLLLVLFLICYSIAIKSQDLIINEFEARNRTTVTDANNEFDDWIEIYNNSSSAVNLSGYYITDDRTMSTKFLFVATAQELTIAAGGYIVLWADGDIAQGSNHLNFKLSGNGGFLGLYSSNLTPIDTFRYPDQLYDISYGRDLNNKTIWRFFRKATPGTSNNTAFYTEVAKTPVFNYKSGVYKLPFSLSMDANGDSIRYSLNTVTPNYKSLVYTDPINISNSTVIRAFASNTTKIGSEVKSQIYLKNKHTLPILAMIIDNDYLFGANGIYTKYDSTGKAWERFAQFKLMNNDTLTREFNAGVRIQGASSRPMEKKSFRLYFKDTYGEEKLHYPIFENKQDLEFNKLVLKAGYDDDLLEQEGKGTLLRDGLSVALYANTGGMPQLSKWFVLYIDTAFWGIYDLRENIDDDFIKTHTQLQDFDLIRFASEGTELHYGTMDLWNSWYKFVRSTDFSKPENYAKLKEMTDMDEFINLMAFVHCSEYRSWGWGLSMYCGKTLGSKWKFSIWDTDRAYTNVNWNGFDDLKNQSSYQWGNGIAYQIYKSSEFRTKLKQRIEELLNGVFEPDYAISKLDSLYEIVKPEIPREINRWNSTVNWENNVEAIREYLRNRPAVLREQMNTYLDIDSIKAPTLEDNLVVNPNPAKTKTTISYYVSKKCKVTISIYNIEGKLVNTLINGEELAGEHKITWNSNSENNRGTYIVTMVTPYKIIRSKVILIK